MTPLDPTKVNLLIIHDLMHEMVVKVVHERQSSKKHERSTVDTKYIPPN